MDNQIITNDGLEFHPIYCNCLQCKELEAIKQSVRIVAPNAKVRTVSEPIPIKRKRKPPRRVTIAEREATVVAIERAGRRAEKTTYCVACYGTGINTIATTVFEGDAMCEACKEEITKQLESD